MDLFTQIPPKIPFFYNIITKNQLLPAHLPLPLRGVHPLILAGTTYCADFPLTTYRNPEINLT